MRVTKKAVIETASNLIDKNGLNDLSLKSVAEALGIRTPSLYNHIESLDDMIREVAHAGMQDMNQQMMNGSIGKTGEDAIKSTAVIYMGYMIKHPGIYEAIQWASWHQTEMTTGYLTQYYTFLRALIKSMGYKDTYEDVILRLLTSILHGYSTLQLRYALEEPEKVTAEFVDSIDTILVGVKQKCGN